MPVKKSKDKMKKTLKLLEEIRGFKFTDEEVKRMESKSRTRLPSLKFTDSGLKNILKKSK
ncbi:MAG TPA: hypothetical protein V6C58_10160 [Allocoleopsis sp.]